MNESAPHLDNLAPVSLAELNNAAALLSRKDRKYLVPLTLAEQLIAQNGLRVLDIDGRRTFRYESVYFDTPDRISYLAAAHKRRRRFKVRTRSYLDSGLCSLEVKTRERRGFTEKHRMGYNTLCRAQLTESAMEFVNGFETIAPVSRDLRPSLTTRYTRTTLLHTSSMSRVTIDTDLQWEPTDGRILSLPDMMIVETKTSGRPCAIDHFLWDVQQRPTKISKFCTGLAALTPGLPANKWNRVLRTHFGWTPEPRRATPRCHNPGQATVTRLDLVDHASSRNGKSAWIPSLEGAGS